MKTFLSGLWERLSHKTETLALPLREFIYFDREKVEDFVSALLAGLPLERREAVTSKPSELAGSVGYSGTGVSLRKGRRDLTQEELLRATNASLFERLHQILEGGGVVVSENASMPLEVGRFVEAKVRIELSALERLFGLIEWFRDLGLITAALPVQKPEQQVGLEWVFKYFDKLAGERESYNVRITPLTKPFEESLFVASLPKAKVRVTKEELSGEYMLFGRVQRKLEQEEKFPLFSLFPESIQLPEEDMSNFLDAFKDMPSMLGSPVTKEDLEISYPAVVITPVAIFR